MLFSSITFLYYFLPVTVLIYFSVPRQWKNFVLLLASFIFYAWGEPKYVILMFFIILTGFGFGLMIEKYQGKRQSQILLVLSSTVCGGILIGFKYLDFLIDNLNRMGCRIPLIKAALPIGISFYTFQIISYLVDVYRIKVKAQKNFISFAAYVSMFPQLIAGPIVRYCDIEKELNQRNHSIEMAAIGIRRFVLGLGKKVLIANTMAELCLIFRATSDPSVFYYWLYAAAFTLHIYFDFSGYSDMAIGLGQLFGFHFPENFNYPYVSRSITEFWRRWHISLGTWFRDYVYIPLKGNRVSKGRWMLNILIVWLLTGFWHGASWNFIIWGLFFGILLIIEKLWLLRWLNKTKVMNHIYVMFTVIVSFVIFNAADLNEAFSDIGYMFGLNALPLVSKEALYYAKSYLVTFLVAILACTPLMKQGILIIKKTEAGKKLINATEPLILTVLMLMITAYLVDGSFNPFIYFRF